jgi:hypothetical protein
LEGPNAVADIPVPLKIVSSNFWPLGLLESLIHPANKAQIKIAKSITTIKVPQKSKNHS